MLSFYYFIVLSLSSLTFLSQMAKCDACKRQGKLNESIKWRGNIKHFCNLFCVLEFCHQQTTNDPDSQSKGKIKLG